VEDNRIRLETYAPLFPGFYETWYKPDEDFLMSDMDEQVIPKLEEAGLMKPGGLFSEQDVSEEYWDSKAYQDSYEEYEREVGREVVEYIEDRMNDSKLDLGEVNCYFMEVHSPREYNFGNDSINMDVKIDKEKFLKAIKGPLLPILTVLVKRKFTSYPGFISFYDNDVNLWLEDTDKMMEDSNQAATCIEALLLYVMNEDEITDETDFDDLQERCETDMQECVLESVRQYFDAEGFLNEFLLKKMEEIIVGYPKETVEEILAYKNCDRAGAILNPILELCGRSESFAHSIKNELTSQALTGLRRLLK
jgi:hypothetical protein